MQDIKSFLNRSLKDEDMCGITGVFRKSDNKEKKGSKNALAEALKALSCIEERGKDGAGIAYDGGSIKKAESISILEDEISESRSESKSAMAHNLHSVVGSVIQPLKGERGVLVTNCEIYNWKRLADENAIDCSNDAELLLKLIEIKGTDKIKEVLDVLDGVFSLAYWDKDDDKVVLARDMLGVKPLWYSEENGLCFSSEKKALHTIGCKDVKELNPRRVLRYDIDSGKSHEEEVSFLKKVEITEKASNIVIRTEDLLKDAIRKRIPKDAKVGVLFSGGIDSVFISRILKDMGVDFSCYTTVLEQEGMGAASDLGGAMEASLLLGLDLKVKKIGLEDVSRYAEKVAQMIEDNNVVKVGVGITMFAACEKAREDGVKVMFSGLGSEEIFAGYDRHKDSTDINDECISGLLKIYERDLYRDDVVAMNNNIELRLPFLDKSLVKYSLSIPSEMKITDEGRNKAILRDIAKINKIPERLAEKPKKAAQYGSKIDRALQKIAKKEGYSSRSEYLKQFYKSPNVRLGVLWSGGKDSAFAAWKMMRQNYEISCMIVMESKNEDSYMFHTPTLDLTDLHSESSGIPLLKKKTEGEKEEELDDLRTAIYEAKNKYNIEGIVTGAIFSNYQRERVERICDELGLKIFSPLWHVDQDQEMREIVREGFKIVISRIAADGLDDSWLGREVTEDLIDRLTELKKKYHINVAGEGGEFESLVLDSPFFKKRLVIDDSHKEIDSENSGVLVVDDAHIEAKE